MADDLGDDWWCSNDENQQHKTTPASTKKLQPQNDVSEIKAASDVSHTKVKTKKTSKAKPLENNSPRTVKRKQDNDNNDKDDRTEIIKKKKRKRILDTVEVNSHADLDTGLAAEQDDSVAGKSIKKKKKKKLANTQVKDDEDTLVAESVESNENNSTATQKKKKSKRRSKSAALAKTKDTALSPCDLTSVLDKHFKEKLSTVEMDELTLTDDHFCRCNDLTHTATSYLKTLMPHWKKMLKGLSDVKGSPLIIVICKSGMRSVDFIRSIPDLQTKGFKIAKLFAKHLKIEEQVKHLQKYSTHIGVGSPNRIQHLIENGALRLDELKYVVLDWSNRDDKLQRLMEIKEIRADVIALLTKHIIPKIRNSSIKIGLF